MFVSGKHLSQVTNLTIDSSYTVSQDCMLSINVRTADLYGHMYIMMNGYQTFTLFDDAVVGGMPQCFSALLPAKKGSVITFAKMDARNKFLDAYVFEMELV